METEKHWIVWSNYHGAFWGPNNSGYATDIDRAGRYTESEADAICKVRDPMSHGTPAEIKIPAPESLEQLTSENRKLSREAMTADCECAAIARKARQERKASHEKLMESSRKWRERDAKFKPQEDQ